MAQQSPDSSVRLPLPRLDLFCIRPPACAATGFEERVRRAAEPLGGLAQIVVTSIDPDDPRGLPGGRPRLAPALLVIVRGRLLAHAVGDLPRRELQHLMADALRNAAGT
jgi:hypothetical protein